MKKPLAAVLVVMGVLAACSLHAQDRQLVKPEVRFSFGLGLGLAGYERITGDQETYMTVSFLPRIFYGRFAAGLDLSLDLNNDFELRDLDDDGAPDQWAGLYDVLGRIEFIRWGMGRDPLQVQVSSIYTYTLGHGLLVERYNPSLFQPYLVQRGLLIDARGDPVGAPWAGLSFMTDDVLDWDVLAGRLEFLPFYSSSSVLSGSTVGLSAAVDLDPREEPLSENNSPPGDNPEGRAAGGLSIDADVLLLEGTDASLAAYGEWAVLYERGSGGMLGLGFGYRRVEVKGELYLSGSGFEPHYFDAWYELDRSTKYNQLEETGSSTGYLVGTAVDLFEKVYFSFSWESRFDPDDGPTIRSRVALNPAYSPRIGAALSYRKRGVDSFADLADLEGSLFELGLSYRVTESAVIQFSREQGFAPWNEPTARTRLQTLFTF